MEGVPTAEHEPKPLFKVTLMRHEEPFYRDEGHDLTPEGFERARERGQSLKESGHLNQQDDVHIVHSPKPRAIGTAQQVARGAGLDPDGGHTTKQLRQSDIHDYERFMQRFVDLGENFEAFARDHHTNPNLYEHDHELIEPSSSKRKRLYRALEYLVRSILKGQKGNGDTTPHIIAVSHFEVITHLIHDVFGIETIGRYNAPAFGESVLLEGFATDSKDVVRLKVTFNEHQREVLFDRVTRSVQPLT